MINYNDYICCPKCKNNLVINDNVLTCNVCNSFFKKEDWVFILIDLNNLPKHLQWQVLYFQNEGITDNYNYSLEPWQKSYINKFKENFQGFNDKVIIDCWTWSGYMAIELARLWANVIATDLTLKSLIRLYKISKGLWLSEKIIFICCSAEDLPLKNNVVDYFISNAVLEHLPKESQAIEEINRITKTNSGLMMCVPLSYKYLNPLLVLINYVHDKRIWHLRRYNELILKDKLSNWNLIKTYYTWHFLKVVTILVNMIVRIFDYDWIEKVDSKKQSNRYWASNIICFFNKK